MPVIQLFIDKFQRVVKIDSDHPLAIAQLAKDTAGSSSAAEADTHKASAPAANTPPAPPASTETSLLFDYEAGDAKQGSIFDLPPELRAIPAVQAHLEGLSRKELQDLAKEHDIAANQSSQDLVELLTLTLTTSADPAPPVTG